MNTFLSSSLREPTINAPIVQWIVQGPSKP